MRSAMERRLGTVFGLVFAILFLIGVIQCQMVATLADAHRKVARTGEMIQELTLTERLLSDADSAVKTYVVTRDAAALQAYDAAASQIPHVLQHFGDLAARDGVPRQKIDTLKSLTNAALDPLQKVANTRGQGWFSGASRQIATGSGQKALADARLALQAMGESQQASLGERSSSLGAIAKLTSIVTTAGSMVALWLLVLIGLVLRHYVNERRQNSRGQVLSVQVLDNMAAGVYLSDETGMILYANPAGHAMFGYEAGELIGHNLSLINEFASQGDCQQFDDIHQQLISDGIWKGEIPGRRRDGSPLTCRVQVSALERAGKMHWIAVEQNLADSRSEALPIPVITAESAEQLSAGLQAA